MAEELDEVERYRKLLEDWKPGSPASKKTGFASTSSVSPMGYTSQKPAGLGQPAAAQPKAAIGTGAILLLNRRNLAIYIKPVPEKQYHLVLMLNPGGSVKAQGVALEGVEIEELGNVATKWVEKVKNELHWERDLIVFHCYTFEDVLKLPADGGAEPTRVAEPQPVQPAAAPQPQAAPQAAPQAPPAAVPHPELNGNLRRGQRIQIQFNGNAWNAVYWGKDDQGQVIAHKTYENWSLMHLDLKRFASTLRVDPEPDAGLVQEIEKSLLNA